MTCEKLYGVESVIEQQQNKIIDNKLGEHHFM